MESSRSQSEIHQERKDRMKIRQVGERERLEILQLHEQAFGKDKGWEIRDLVDGLLDDPSAKPLYSFGAFEKDWIVGHVLFTKVTLIGAKIDLSAQILAPLAVLPEWHNKGVGGQLIETGLAELRSLGVQLVFVLGHPGYYPRYGFLPAGRNGFDAPYPIPDEHADAWMVQELISGTVGGVEGTIQCADILNQPQHWRE